MLTMKDFLSKKERGGQIGIEVEVEFPPEVPTGNGDQITNPDLKNIGGVWLAKLDGSLKNGIEYYTRQPIMCDDKKLERIKQLTDKLGLAVQGSPRTSVHVHCNIQDLTPVQLWTAILAYWMVENPLMEYCGNEFRVGNLFCLRLSDADAILNLCYRDLQKKDKPFETFKLDICKYGGQNLSAIRRFGSIEYRGMRGTTDPTLIDDWSTAVHTLINKAKAFTDPSELMNYYRATEKDALLTRLLGYDFAQKVKSHPDYAGLVKQNILRLCDLAYFHDDWIKWGEKISEQQLKNLEKEKPRRYIDILNDYQNGITSSDQYLAELNAYQEGLNEQPAQTIQGTAGIHPDFAEVNVAQTPIYWTGGNID